MRSLISAVCVLLAITVFVAISSFYICGFCLDMIEAVKELPMTVGGENDCRNFNDGYTAIHEMWEKKRSYIRCTVGHTDAEDIDNALEEMESRFSSGDLAGYLSARGKLISLINELRQAEKLSWYSLG